MPANESMSAKGIRADSLKRAVELANALRRKMPGEQLMLADLPPGRPRSAHKCILARAFNFNCVIDAGGEGSWHAIFFNLTKEQSGLIQEWALENHLLHTGDVDKDNEERVYYVVDVALPPVVGLLATEFDNDRLPAEYYETQVDKDPYEEQNG